MSIRRKFCSAIVLLSASFCGAQQQPGSPIPGAEGTSESLPIAPTFALKYEIVMSANEPWKDTGIDLKAGDFLKLQAGPFAAANNTKENLQQKICNPDGVPQSDPDRDLPVPGAAFGALIARNGGFHRQPFVVGHETSQTIPEPGRLFLSVNTDGDDVCEGQFRLSMTIVPSMQPDATSFEGDMNPELSEMIDRLPRRIDDGMGHEGDLVNFIVLGPEKRVRKTLADAGWVLVDRVKSGAAVHALMKMYYGQDYLEMPMSNLYLFGRVQDYGYARAEPYKVVASRHHFRLWKAPWTSNGEEVWVGAGTHDIGFEKDQRGRRITHKIDPAIDRERDYIATTLDNTHEMVRVGYVLPENPVYEGHNATGGQIVSDGRIAVLHVSPAEQDAGAPLVTQLQDRNSTQR